MLGKNQKSKKEMIEELIKELKRNEIIKEEDFDSFQKSKEQIIIINTLGRLIWMNDLFKEVNLKYNDTDLFETLYNEIGFEAYQEIFDKVTNKSIDKLEENGISFVRIKLLMNRKEYSTKIERILDI